jgi:type I restriction enzyme S subunit
MAVTMPLKDLCTIDITDGTHKTPTYADEGYIFLSSKNVTSGVIDWDNVMYIPASLHNELYKRIAPQKNDILLAKNGTTGVAAIVDRDEVFDIYVSLALIRPDETKVLPRYLLHAINSYPTKQFFDSHLKGIGVPNLHLTHIRETPIRVPSFTEQKQITDVLDKVDELIALRKEQLAKLDQLVKSRFIELFEDGESPIKSVEELCSAIVDCPHTTPKYEGELKNPAIRTAEIKKGYIEWETMRYVSDEEYEERTARLKPEAGDIVYGREGTFGNAAILPKGHNFCLGQRVMLLRPDYSKCTSEYLLYAVISDDVYRQALEKNNASTVAHVNVKDVKQFRIPLPSFDKQNQFAVFVEQVDKSKFVIQ